MMRAGGCACEAAGVLFATTSAVGHRVLIQAPGGFAYANQQRGRRAFPCPRSEHGRSDSILAAGHGSPPLMLPGGSGAPP